MKKTEIPSPGIRRTKAKYSPSLAYAGNPLIEALPEQLMIQELHDALYSMPVLPQNLAKFSPRERIEMIAKNVYGVYLPMDYAAQIYLTFYRGLRSAYDGREQRTIVQQLSQIGKAISEHKEASIPDGGIQAQSFAIIGDTGMGKSITVRKILNLFPQVIEHTKYNGAPFHHIQVPYICVECPGQDSPRGICIQILGEMDKVLGTDLTHEATMEVVATVAG